MSKEIINAFHPDFMKHENIRTGKKPDQNTYKHMVAMVKFVENQRKKNSNFGTLTGVSKVHDSLAPKQFNVYSKAGAK